MSERHVTDTTDLAAAFERQRPYLRTVALRMLGSGDDADDAVQEAWLRLNRGGGEGIDRSGRPDGRGVGRVGGEGVRVRRR